MLKYIVAVLCATLVSCVSAQQKEQRVALVIGNSSYKSSPLKNPVNDARDMANSLRGYGFTVIERTNLTTRQVGQTLREFRSKLTPGSVAVFFMPVMGSRSKVRTISPLSMLRSMAKKMSRCKACRLGKLWMFWAKLRPE